MKEVTEIVQNPIDSILPQAQLFARLDAGMARSHWTEKVCGLLRDLANII